MTTIHYYIQNVKALGLVVSEKIVFMFFSMTPPKPDLYGPQWHGWQDSKRTTIHESSGSCEKIFHVFPIVSLWELSVAMETRVLIRPGPKPNATFPPPQ